MSPARLEEHLARLEHWGPPGPGRETSVLETVRSFLADVGSDLAELHRAGAPGGEINSRHSDLMDRLLRRLFQLAEAEYFAEGHGSEDRVAVLAVGGYARR